ncbi:F-box/kelch-repeat protein At3g06240-like [Cornus florida]|uniref:F-box/kelch-repeat protein At3g06240-like n=1 Tax=Cornus florida TaxID=4283 RepID=UPI00289AD485|nr:F-box/kelch-repeat protein At3g06240-like [Cornus florida]
MARGKRRVSSRSNLLALPEEILIQIFVRLPVKSLVQVRSICKSWYSLITDRSFIESHLKHQTSPSNNIYSSLFLFGYKPGCDIYSHWRYAIRYDDESFGEYFKPELPVHISYLSVCGSCNGLVCLSGRPIFASRLGWPIYLWNPALRRMKTLPEPPSLDPTLGAFYSVYVAFGFDYRGNDYKVVEIICFPPKLDKNSLFIVNVYSLSTDSWRRISVASPSCKIWIGALPEIMNGAAYWIASVNMKSENSLYTLLQFDLGDEVFREIILPDGARHILPEIAVLGESLYLYNFWGAKTYQCDVWTMECSKVGTWTKRFTFRFSDANVNDWSKIGFRRNGEILRLNHKNCLVSYNLENKQAEDLGFHACRISFLHSYVESLILLPKEDSYST